ncbi:ATP synthase F1 subunit delta [Geovibrio ferrireducens]|uniref:ATP synthase F1 subunit delta n=1 Tax=Geovibrio ferrireducens TaxID=46201 RepID=UPI0022480BF0|nr:ATP synthase F1 subunit delta [Geovibrio ferrireducens]
MRTQVAARRYASALYEEARSAGSLSSVIEKLDAVAALAGDSKDFGVFVKNPVISKEDKATVIRSLNDKGMLDGFTSSFLVMLAMKNRLELLDEISGYLKTLAMEEKGEAVAEVTSATELSGDAVKSLEEALSKITGKKITAVVTVDKSILGGVVAKVGSTLYDASIRGQINKIRDRLIS